ncbi:SET domain-containing protein [Aureococcus anophagefferens]|nr:SET domain-containing protein [Aureococcus anophagefferens]
MRVTKKYSRTRLLRKTAFVRAASSAPTASRRRARAAFLADEPQYCPRRAPPATRRSPAPRRRRRRQRTRAAGQRARRAGEDEAPGEDAAEAPGEDCAEAPGEDAAPAPAAGALRRGKWTKPEEHYAALVIDHFATGKLPGLTGGESLRLVLSDLLRCTRMRVTKKLSQTKILRKSCFWPLGELTAEEHAELDAARDQFIAAEPHYRRARAPLDGAGAAGAGARRNRQRPATVSPVAGPDRAGRAAPCTRDKCLGSMRVPCRFEVVRREGL